MQATSLLAVTLRAKSGVIRTGRLSRVAPRLGSMAAMENGTRPISVGPSLDHRTQTLGPGIAEEVKLSKVVGPYNLTKRTAEAWL